MKLFRKSISILLCFVLVFGTAAIGEKGFSGLFNVDATALKSYEETYKNFIENHNFSDDLFDTSFGVLFAIHDIDGDGLIDLIACGGGGYVMEYCIYSIENGSVELYGSTGTSKGGIFKIKDSSYPGIVAISFYSDSTTSSTYYCSYCSVSLSLSHEFKTEDVFNFTYNLRYSTKFSERLTDDITLFNLCYALDENGDFTISSNLEEFEFLTVDEINEIGWEEFFNPSWSYAYYQFYEQRNHTKNFIDPYFSDGDEYTGLALKDLNNDAIPELIVRDPWYTGRNGHGWIYTYKDGKVVTVGSADSWGGSFYPHNTNDINYPGFWTYIYMYDSTTANDMPFHLVYYSFDGNELTYTYVCADYDTPGVYQQITDDYNLYKAVVDSEENSGIDLTTEDEIDDIKWKNFVKKYCSYSVSTRDGNISFEHNLEYYLKNTISSSYYNSELAYLLMSFAQSAYNDGDNYYIEQSLKNFGFNI